jgi:hypothetical protein
MGDEGGGAPPICLFRPPQMRVESHLKYSIVKSRVTGVVTTSAARHLADVVLTAIDSN